jgi:hypothetical protein
MIAKVLAKLLLMLQEGKVHCNERNNNCIKTKASPHKTFHSLISPHNNKNNFPIIAIASWKQNIERRMNLATKIKCLRNQA